MNDIERTRPVDCTLDEFEREELDKEPDYKLSKYSAAMKMFGRPWSQLSRPEQKELDKVMGGHLREMRATIKSLKTNNMLSVEQRASRIGEMQNKIHALTELQIIDCEEAMSGRDDIEASAHPLFGKHASTSPRRRQRTLNNTIRMVKTLAETEAILAKISTEKQAPVFVDKAIQNNNYNDPQAVRDEFADFIDGDTKDGREPEPDGDAEEGFAGESGEDS